MNSYSCEVATIENDEEVYVGRINVFNIPRVGEHLWFSKEQRGHTSWTVEDVCYHVGNGDGGFPYQSVVIYVKPTVLKEWNDDLPQPEGSN